MRSGRLNRGANSVAKGDLPPLAFPANSYHRLVKDYKLVRDGAPLTAFVSHKVKNHSALILMTLRLLPQAKGRRYSEAHPVSAARPLGNHLRKGSKRIKTSGRSAKARGAGPATRSARSTPCGVSYSRTGSMGNGMIHSW